LETRRDDDGLLRPPAWRSPTDEILRSIIRHWHLVALIAAAGAILAALVSTTRPKLYRAESVSAVGLLPAAMTTSETLHGVDTLDRRVVIASIAELASTGPIRDQVHAAGDDVIDAVVLPSTSLFRVTVAGRDPTHLAQVANAIPKALDVQARSLYAVYNVVPVAPAVKPVKPYAPRVERAAFAGLVAGILAGFAAAYLLDRRRLHAAT